MATYLPRYPDTQNIQTANRDASTRRPVLKSPSALYSFSPRTVVRPTTEDEIIQAVHAAAQENLKVRAIGSLHSLAPIPATEGICIVLDQYKEVVKIQGSLVTVQSGMKLQELNQILAQHNLALPVMGAIVEQTVAGAISTGTHGGSLHYQNLSGCVQALRLIRADGSVVESDRAQDIFNAVVISMGLLGIISTVTFQCVPAFSLQSEVCTMPMETFIEQFDQIQQTNQHVDMRYSPITDTAHMVLINPAAEPILKNGGWQAKIMTKQEWQLKNFVIKFGQRFFLTHRFNWLQRWIFRQYDQTIYTSPYGRSDFVLTHFDGTANDLINDGNFPDLLDPVADMELGVHYAQAPAAITCLRDYFRITRRYPNTHIHIRCTAADGFWLSPTYNQAICWLEFWEYPCTGKFFQEIVELLKSFLFRPHWGKQIPVESAYLRQQYDKWTDFLKLRQTWDPERRFSNTCLDYYFDI